MKEVESNLVEVVQQGNREECTLRNERSGLQRPCFRAKIQHREAADVISRRKEIPVPGADCGSILHTARGNHAASKGAPEGQRRRNWCIKWGVRAVSVISG